MKNAPRSIGLLCGLSLFGLLSFAGAGLNHAKPHAAKKSIPYSKVSHLIATKCELCHNATRHPGGVDLSSYKALMKGGEDGRIVVKGQPKKSALIQYVNGKKKPRMPFKRAPLTMAEINLLTRWVKAGAKG